MSRGSGLKAFHPHYSSTANDKVEWMIRHIALWQDWPSLSNEEQWRRRKDVAQAMKRDGLYSKNTYWKDVSVLKLIELARWRLEY